MPTINHLSKHVNKYGIGHKHLYVMSIMIMFWCIFDGLLSYVTPLVLTEAGFSETLMGIIIGTSSIAGAFFDFFICKLFRNAIFRKIFLTLFLVCSIYPLVLWQAKSFWAFICAMILWGIYYDLYNFGTLSFIGNYTNKDEHASSSGVLQVFRSLGYLLAPILAGFAIGEVVGWQSFALSWIFLLIAFLFFVTLIGLTKRKEKVDLEKPSCENLEIKKEFKLWQRTSKLLRPVLILTILISVYDAFFWTIGPLFAESFTALKGFEGFFLAAYELPALLIGWFVGGITLKFGKKKTAYYAFILGSILLSTLSLINMPIIIIGITFLSSMFLSMTIPAINGAFADYISEAPKVEGEIEAVGDFSNNIGYIIGPISAGILADLFNNAVAFSILSVMGIFIVLILIKITPKEINVKPLERSI